MSGRREERVGHQIPDLDTEPHEPAKRETGSKVTDSDLLAPPMPEISDVGFFDKTRPEPTDSLPTDSLPTVDVEVPFSESRWEQSKEFQVALPRPPRDKKLERRVRSLTLALSVASSLIAGGLFGEYLLPRIVDRVQAEDVAPARVAKSRRRITAARRLGDVVSSSVLQLQREAEAAIRDGDPATALAKLEEIEATWSE